MPVAPESAEAASRLAGAALLAVAALALVLRVAFVLLEPANKPAGDEHTWLGWALEPPGGIASEKVRFSPFRNHMIFYPPLYAYFIAALHEVFGSLTAVKLGQAVLGTLIAVAVAVLGARVLGARVGLTAGLAAAMYPDLIWFAGHFWSELLFMTFLWWGFERVIAADGARGVARAAAAGLLWGLAILTRETALYFVPVAAAWLAWGQGTPGRRRGAIFVITALLTVAPWTYRNWVEFHAFIPVSTAGGQNLFQGNTRIPRDETYLMVDAQPGRVAQYRYAMRMGFEAIRDRQPWWIFEKLYEQMPNFWEADNLAVIHVKRGADEKPGGYGPTSTATAWLVAALTIVPYLLILAFFVRGLVDVPLTRPLVLLVLFLLYQNAIHVVTHGFARYRLPAMPVVFVIAAWGLWALGRARLASPARRWAAAVVAVVLVWCLIPGLRATAAHPAFGGQGRLEALERP